MIDLLIPLDRDSPVALRDQLYSGLRQAVLDGRLTVGDRVPASRLLARSLGISRFTVDDAYSRLIADGYLVGRHGSGTFVAYGPLQSSGSASDTGVPPVVDRGWSQWANLLPCWRQPAGSTYRYSFKQGVPALDQVPIAIWRRCQARVELDVSSLMFGYGETRGFLPLRTEIASYLARARMVRCSPDQIVITSGTQQALDLIARLFIDTGDHVAVEEPGYPTARRVFHAAGADLVPVPVDGDGLQIDRLPGGDVKLLYVTPSHQFPTGGILPLHRRLALLEWARARGSVILEDDYDSEFRYGQRPVEALAALDGTLSGAGSVIYIGTFSKVLFPALRLGYLVLPPDIVANVLAAKEIADRHPSTLEQATLARFMAEGHFERHLARMRRIYASRLVALESALSRHFGPRAVRDPASTAAGLHLLVWFDLPYGEGELVDRAVRAGIQIEPASPCYVNPPARPGALFGYATMDETRIESGMACLAKALLT